MPALGTDPRLSVVVLPHLCSTEPDPSSHVIKHSNHITNKHGFQSTFCHHPTNYNLVSQNLLVRGHEGLVPWSNTFHLDYSFDILVESICLCGHHWCEFAKVMASCGDMLTDTWSWYGYLYQTIFNQGFL